MGTLTRRVACLVLVCASGCGGLAPVAPREETADAAWGDDYAGIEDDLDREEALALPRRRQAASLDVLADPAPTGADDLVRSLRAAARHGHAAARYRESAGGRAGALEVFDAGWLRQVVVGAMRPSLGEGAWLSDARELGTPVPRATPAASMLRVAPSSSRWGSVLGAGVTVGARRAQWAAALWRPHDEDTTWTACSALEWRVARTQAGVAAAATARPSGRPRCAVSLLLSRAFRSGFAALETAAAASGVSCAARVVLGDGWRASLAAGTPAPADVPVGAARRERRMAVIERHGRFRAVSSRVAASSVTRRAGTEEERRRRVEAGFHARLDDGVRLQGGLRFVERVVVAVPSLLSPGAREAGGEWRARVALVARENPARTIEVEHVFRVDAVRVGPSLGMAGTWRGTMRRGPLAGSVQASAWGMKPGQLGYLGRAGLPGSSAFTTVSGAGSDLSVVVRGHLGERASIAAEWRRKASGEEDVRVAASLAW